MDWDDLLEEQKRAAQHAGSHARLLAGPGTGKTLALTWRIRFLVNELHAPPEGIFALTFTRAAARELHQRVADALQGKVYPRISTLHSFALRQIIKNEHIITSLSRPLRIADDWEERHIVLEDMKSMLGLSYVSEAESLINQMSSDWESLNADDEGYQHPNPEFLGAWKEHREVYGYTLRAELVYQLKKSLETEVDFELENPINHLIIDEYQDLNKCDLAVIRHLEQRGTELFIAGDDDQSIYGFRKAHPDGIRKFLEDYPGATNLGLQICKRCDRDILDIGLFVAKQDIRRVKKNISSDPSVGEGEVKVLRFPEQSAEAHGIANLCRHLVDHYEYDLDDILILLRSDRNGSFSRPIQNALQQADIPVSSATASNILDNPEGRNVLAFLRLLVHHEDSLAWRTILKCWAKGVGDKTVDSIYDIARSENKSFARIILDAHSNNDIIPSEYRKRLCSAISKIISLREQSINQGALDEHDLHNTLVDAISPAINFFVAEDDDRLSIISQLEYFAIRFETRSLAGIIRSIGSEENEEPDIVEGKVNILTMHRAKGLTASAVIVAAAEDEYIPGRAGAEEEGDERRLLYVSLTRARHHLFVSYCNRRTGEQKHTGRDSGKARRHITRFLRESRYRPQDGMEFIATLEDE